MTSQSVTPDVHFPVERLNSVETPCYYYDTRLLGDTLDAVNTAASHPAFRVHYAVKANTNPRILSRVAAAGLGADTVSIGEVEAAIEAGFPAGSIVFAGVGKTDREITRALRLGVGCLNVESAEELDAIVRIAAETGIKAPVALRINPEIDAHTHHYITTGLAENKFGIAISMLRPLMERCRDSQHLQFRELHFHIGSQITDLTPYRLLCERINTLRQEYEDFDIPWINVGGGLGIDYDHPDIHPIPDFDSYFDVFARHLHLSPGQEVHFELGRSIVAQCGSLITRVTYVKQGVAKKFIIVDAGMTDLIRPALYQAHHKIDNITSAADAEEVYDVVGPVCESSDCFGRDERLPLTQRGDLLALRSAGAYGEVMASAYNCRHLPGSLFSDSF